MDLYKEYKSSSFQTKIEISLANISSSPTDEFKLIKTSYYPFNCELCGHQHCVYQFTIENLKTHRQLDVGSECIHHFQGRGVDIDLALGLLKRIRKTVLIARKEMRSDIDKESYEKFSIEDKRQLTIKYFMREQAKDLLRDVAINKAILSKQQINDILDLGLDKELERAQDFAKQVAERSKRIQEQLDKQNEKYKWLIRYSGSNYIIRDIRDRFIRNGRISDKQEEYARSLIMKEKAPQVLSFLMAHDPSDFVKSVYEQLNKKGYISPNQQRIVYKIYNSKRENEGPRA